MLGLISRERENENINDTRKTENIPLDKARNDCIPNCRVAEMVNVKWQDVIPVQLALPVMWEIEKCTKNENMVLYIMWIRQKNQHIVSPSALNLRDGLRIFPY